MIIKRPMKGAAVEDLSVVRFPKSATPKIDGFRLLLGRTAMTSRLARFPNTFVHKELKGLVDDGIILDGEIVVGKNRGPGVLQRTSSGVTSREGKPDFTFWVFDYFGEEPYWKRQARASLLVKELDHPRIKFLRSTHIPGREELDVYLSEQLRRGYEGIYLRDPNGLYKQGKSTLIQQWGLKVKPFVDAEGIVIGYYEEQENTNEAERDATGKLKRSSAKSGKVAKGRLGGLILKVEGVEGEVRVGGGYTEKQRIQLWEIRDQLIGKRVRFKKQMIGEKDKPRHPNFLEFVDFRPEWDE